MTPDKVFKIANAIALIPWILMAVPRFASTEKIINPIINSNVFPVILAGLYVFYIGMSLGKASGGFLLLGAPV